MQASTCIDEIDACIIDSMLKGEFDEGCAGGIAAGGGLAVGLTLSFFRAATAATGTAIPNVWSDKPQGTLNVSRRWLIVLRSMDSGGDG